MSMESDLTAALKAVCHRTFPDIAHAGTAAPYVTYQALGGESLRYVDGQASNRRNTYMQINVWSETRAEALTLIRQIEDALCTSTAFVANPQGEPLSTYELDTQIYGSLQRFDIWSSR